MDWMLALVAFLADNPAIGFVFLISVFVLIGMGILECYERQEQARQERRYQNGRNAAPKERRSTGANLDTKGRINQASGSASSKSGPESHGPPPALAPPPPSTLGASLGQVDYGPRRLVAIPITEPEPEPFTRTDPFKAVVDAWRDAWSAQDSPRDMLERFAKLPEVSRVSRLPGTEMISVTLETGETLGMPASRFFDVVAAFYRASTTASPISEVEDVEKPARLSPSGTLQELGLLRIS